MTQSVGQVVYGVSPISDHDIYLFKQGNHFRLYEKLGSHPGEVQGQSGVHFAVWCPNAKKVSVCGDFNGWDSEAHPLTYRLDGSGIWEGFVPGVQTGSCYKYRIASQHHGYTAEKGDPFSLCWESPPKTASRVWSTRYDWKDLDWMADRKSRNSLSAPISIYEVHLGSWRRSPDEEGRSLSYRELAEPLASYLKEMGFTHVEMLPVMEHPFYGSWGYQTVGYFAPTSRYGSPEDFMYLVDYLHQQGIGVILDWVPSHFPSDLYGLIYFDGTHLYEHADTRKGYHPDWHTAIFNYGRNEVRSFLISSALFWLDRYHADGLRTDAVASMLYLDYARRDGDWIPNKYGGRENLEAIDFIKRLNTIVYQFYPDVQAIAEESTAWPMVTRPTHVGGLGFGFKWNMGWMHDTLEYFSKDPVHRKFHHNQLTFSIWYAFTENYILPLSHDEVVYGKGSLLGKMPGDDWQKFANLRVLFGYMYGHPGKKLIFMGGEIGQWNEWYHETSLDWHLLQYAPHHGIQLWLRDLNRVYLSEPALYDQDTEEQGFAWIDFRDADNSIMSFLRRGRQPGQFVVVICNLTPVPRTAYRVGLPVGGPWLELLNSDSELYGGSGDGNLGKVQAEPTPSHSFPFSAAMRLPPLSVIFLKPQEAPRTEPAAAPGDAD